MDLFSKKNFNVDKRLKKVSKELGLIDKDIDSLSKALDEDPGGFVSPRLCSDRRSGDELRIEKSVLAKEEHSPELEDVLDDMPAEPDGSQGLDDDGFTPRDKRFASYFLSDGLQATQPLRAERRSQRNRAVLLIILVALAAWLILGLVLKA